MSRVELSQLVGKFKDSHNRVRRAAWDMDIVLLDGRQIATISRRPGAKVSLLHGVMLTGSERIAVEKAIEHVRGVRPAAIVSKVKPTFELLDDVDEDEDEDATELEVDEYE